MGANTSSSSSSSPSITESTPSTVSSFNTTANIIDSNNNEVTTTTSSGCPIQHKNVTTITTSSSSEKSSECPVKYKNPSVYNVSELSFKSIYQTNILINILKYFHTYIYFQVYNTKINPNNQMPITPNQAPSSTQSIDLSIDRVKSSIPKGGTDTETWTYPSPQMVC